MTAVLAADEVPGRRRWKCINTFETAKGETGYTYVWRHPECYAVMSVGPDGSQSVYEIAACGFCIEWLTDEPCPYHHGRHAEPGPMDGYWDAHHAWVAQQERQHVELSTPDILRSEIVLNRPEDALTDGSRDHSKQPRKAEVREHLPGNGSEEEYRAEPREQSRAEPEEQPRRPWNRRC